MADVELEKVIATWEKILTEIGQTRNMRVIVNATLVQLYALRIFKEQSASALIEVKP